MTTRPLPRAVAPASSIMAALAVSLALATHATAEPCAFATREAFKELQVSRVKTGAPRVALTKEDCQPSRKQSCAMSAYVMPGDVVLIGQVFDASACALYVDARGRATQGLLPNNRLEAVRPAPPAGAAALLGNWVREEATIAVKAKGRDGTLSFKGEATYGAKDARRVAMGAVNMGDFDFDYRPAGNSLHVGIGAAAGKQVVLDAAKTDKSDCQLAMIGLGPYLVVQDNLSCGGMNVSFTGVYRRK